MSHKDYDRKSSVEKRQERINGHMIPEGLGAKTN
jgi:hypothetical protein